MDRNEIAALAKGMIPFVRECVEAECSKALVPPELAAQVADAVRLLNEAPPIQPPALQEAKSLPRVMRIERDDDGNLIPIYDGGQP
jgi:hypothetical protein